MEPVCKAVSHFEEEAGPPPDEVTTAFEEDAIRALVAVACAARPHCEDRHAVLLLSGNAPSLRLELQQQERRGMRARIFEQAWAHARTHATGSLHFLMAMFERATSDSDDGCASYDVSVYTAEPCGFAGEVEDTCCSAEMLSDVRVRKARASEALRVAREHAPEGARVARVLCDDDSSDEEDVDEAMCEDECEES